ncbi:type III polyketide synthase [Tundrisphaera sp. TA3]|uniref:type III polyketide synthase n=1 Tax=Tundrisphaera sp. TA3 TaxID=3435775 RepID=UPI003EBCA6FC
MRLAIGGMGTALPEHSLAQERAAALSSHLSGHDDGQAKRLAALYRKSGVRRRHLAMLDRSEPETPPEGLHGATTRWRMERYDCLVRPLAREAAGKALAASGVAPSSITHLVTVSCTGFAAPGFDLALIGGLGLDPGVQRTHVGFMGCHGALNGLRVARAFAGSEPRARVLLCAAELCALHFQEGWEADDAVANALFADGSAALVLGSDLPSGDRWEAAGSGSYLLPDCGDAMSWTIGDQGFAMTLSSRVAPIIAEALRPWLEGWLAPFGLAPDDVRTWAVHPGGPRIIDAVETALGLDRQATAVSRDVLAQCGNMSSPTILFILDRLRRQDAPRPCVALAFGPGLAIEAALFL